MCNTTWFSMIGTLLVDVKFPFESALMLLIMVSYSNGNHIAGEEDNGRKSKNGNGKTFFDSTSFFVHTIPQQNLDTLKIPLTPLFVSYLLLLYRSSPILPQV